jgi:S-adenosylmethionine synthetase
MKNYIFTSESVGIGHPDKICDQISDAILDACLEQDPESRVAVETLVTTQLVIIAGEVTTNAKVDYEKIARKTIKKIGYTHPEINFDHQKAKVEVKIHKQSKDISQGISEGEGLFKKQGAGDQGIMFGYATNETENLMPLAIDLAHKLVQRAKELREKDENSFLFPDCKSQLTIEYSNEKPKIKTVVLSLNHKESITLEALREYAIKEIIKPICEEYLTDKTQFLINPTGKFVIGGPDGDTGLTGRKIIVDTYGGYAKHGGGAFSGKDPTKVDRSAAYAARWVAKNLVASEACDKCEIQLSYAIGYSQPLNITIDFFNTEKYDPEKINKIVRETFDLSPKGIIENLNLKKPIYEKTAFGGHFGQNPSEDYFPWEKTNKVKELKEKLEKS